MRQLILLLLATTACGRSETGPESASSRCEPCADCPDAAPCEPPPVVACPPCDHDAGAPPRFRRVGWGELPGWEEDTLSAAVPPLLKSCDALAKRPVAEPVGSVPYGGTAGEWRPVCARARELPPGDDASARAFFEREFRAYEVTSEDGASKFTGYYVQEMAGSRSRAGAYQYPVLARPPDLVEVELSNFVGDGRGRRIWGRVDGAGRLVPYPSRAEIRAGKIGDRRRVLLWADDVVDAVFAEIQGSAVVSMADGSTAWLRFDGKNGHPFRGVGGILRSMGELRRGEGTMQGIRRWFEAHPDRAWEIIEKNPAKVFFAFSEIEGAQGTQKVALTPERSVAVDRGVIPLSAPLWVETRVPTEGGPPRDWRRLVVAQDTGGAILGAVRGDIYFGHTSEAAAIAGRMSGTGRWWLLLPKSVPAPPSK